MSYVILQILPYITIAIFIVGIIYRLGRWARARIVHNITLSTPEFPKSVTGAVAEAGTDIIFFKSLFNLDRGLWVGAWPMHVALGAILGGHFMGIYFLGKQFAFMPGITEQTSEQMSSLLGLTFGILIFFALLYLLYRRLAVDYVKKVSLTSDYLHLFLLIAIVSVGNFMRLFPGLGIEYTPVKEYVTNLLMFQPVPISAEVMQKPLFAIHLLLVQVLLIVFPFSKLMHLLGMFGSKYIVTRPYHQPAPGMEKAELLKRMPVVTKQLGRGV